MPRTAVTSKDLYETIVNAPVAGDSPGLYGIVGASNPDFFNGFVPIFRDIGSRRLHRAQFVDAARHQRALLAVPLPVVAEPCKRHGKRGRSELGVLPARAVVRGDFHSFNGTRAGPREARDFVEAGTGELLAAGRIRDNGFRSDLVRQRGD